MNKGKGKPWRRAELTLARIARRYDKKAASAKADGEGKCADKRPGLPGR